MFIFLHCNHLQKHANVAKKTLRVHAPNNHLQTLKIIRNNNNDVNEFLCIDLMVNDHFGCPKFIKWEKTW